MAALNYYLGLKRGADNHLGNVVAGTSSSGTAVDVEVNIQINNGSNATGITRLDVNLLLRQILEYIDSGALNNGTLGADLPGL